MADEDIKPGYTRISSISSAFTPFGDIPRETLENAGRRGDRVHDIIFNILNDIVVPQEMYEWNGKPLQGYIDSFNRFWDKLERPIILMQEDRLYEDKLMITGKMDLLIHHKGETILLDWKTSNAISTSWDIQSGGYHELLDNGYSEENPGWVRPDKIDTIIFVHLNKDGKFPKQVDLSYSKQEFKIAFDLYKKYFKNVKIDLENL